MRHGRTMTPISDRVVERSFPIPVAMHEHIATALNHVANTVFELDEEMDDSPEKQRIGRTHRALMSAASACLKAKATGEPTVGFTKDELVVMPEALNHVASEIYDGEGDIADGLHEFSQAISPGWGFLGKSI